MTCFNTGWAYLADYQFWDERTGIITAAVAVIALLIAWRQLWGSRKESRRATAYAAYSKFLELCEQNPNFAYAKEVAIKADSNKHIKYRWFVAQMLFAFEQILDVLPNDEKWNTTITNQLQKHCWHLKDSGSVKREEWNRPLQDLIEDVIK